MSAVENFSNPQLFSFQSGDTVPPSSPAPNEWVHASEDYLRSMIGQKKWTQSLDAIQLQLEKITPAVLSGSNFGLKLRDEETGMIRGFPGYRLEYHEKGESQLRIVEMIRKPDGEPAFHVVAPGLRYHEECSQAVVKTVADWIHSKMFMTDFGFSCWLTDKVMVNPDSLEISNEEAVETLVPAFKVIMRKWNHEYEVVVLADGSKIRNVTATKYDFLPMVIFDGTLTEGEPVPPLSEGRVCLLNQK